MAGILASQVVLYGTSLTGKTLLLPLELLARHVPSLAASVPPSIDISYADLILVDEVMRVRSCREMRAGRIPLWDPDNFAGAPFVANNVSAVFSPWRVIDYLWPGPRSLAWIQLSRALVGGLGAYLYFRRVLRVRFWPAAIGAWCFPICGYLVMWCGFGSSGVVTWLPWMFLATDAVLRRPAGWSGPSLACITTLVLLSGHLGDGAQVLLASGLYAVWNLIALARLEGILHRRTLLRVVTLCVAWAVGICLAAPQILPTQEYMQHSYRMAARGQNVAERPALGWAALPQLAAPYWFGSTRADQRYLLPGYLQESAAAGYAGLTTALLLAPLGWRARHRTSLSSFWLFAALIGAAALLGIPGFSQLVQLPGLRIFTFNRMIFLTAFALLALGVLGLDTLGRRAFRWRRWMWLPPLAALVFAVASIIRVVSPPIEFSSYASTPILGIFPVPTWFLQTQLITAVLCFFVAACWLTLRMAGNRARLLVYLVPYILWTEMLWNAYGVNRQSDPSLYYSPIPSLSRLKELPWGRLCGQQCFSPMLNQMYGLEDIRGYDGVDPRWVVELLLGTEPEQSGHDRPWTLHAITMHHIAPVISPVHDLLGVRYLLFRGTLPKEIPLVLSGADSQDYSVYERSTALPRTFVPRYVVPLRDDHATLRLVSSHEFRPRDVAFVDGPPEMKSNRVEGEARITRADVDEVAIAYDLQFPGLVVLADTWYPGWRAWVDGREAPILRTDYALRGVQVPAGQGEIIFRYEPASFWRGVRVSAFAILVLSSWMVVKVSVRLIGRAPAPRPSR
ncbi:MAG: hypothetical protein KF708_16110 [Pirellulales bacterium]|nr:hypothetical protein [Pirellulales bacterium]